MIIKNMKFGRSLGFSSTVLLVAFNLGSTLNSRAQTNESVEDLRQQIQQLDQKIRILERKLELGDEAGAEKAKNTPILSIGANGFTFSSADSNFVASLHGLVQYDSRTFISDGGIQNNDSFLLRRARPIFSGTVYRDFDFLFVPDFGGNTVQIQDAYLNYRYSPEFQLEAGKFKSPVGLEQLQPDVSTAFNERSLATDLVPNRDVGALLHGDLFSGALGYSAGIVNGSTDYGGTTTNSDASDDLKEVAGRIFAQPWKNSHTAALRGVGFGVAGSYGKERGTNSLTPGFTTDGQQKLFTYTNGVAGNGTHWRVSPQAYYYYGPFNLLGEYVISDQRVSRAGYFADLQNTAWQIEGGWVLSGEDVTYAGGVVPRHPFDPRNGQWGAFQLVGRYAGLNVDGAAFPLYANPATSASAARAWAVGLNWYLNRDLRLNTSFSRTTFTGGNGATATVTKHPENVLFTRIQLAF
jgi:phosphate-selective porin OprO and OprP